MAEKTQKIDSVPGEKEDQSLVADIVDKYENHPLIGDEHTNRAYWKAFKEGHQWVKINDDKRLINEMNANKRHRSRLNQIKPNGAVAISRLLREMPIVRGAPTGSDEGDRQSARLITDVFDWAWRDHDKGLMSKAYLALDTCYVYGTSWWMIRWNPNLYARTKGNGNKTQDGDWEVCVLDDFEVFPDPGEREYSNLKWIVYAYTADVKELKRLYPDVDGIKAFGENEIENNRNNYVSYDYRGDTRTIKNRALVFEYWERPTEERPDGRKVVVINKSILADDDKNPFACFGWKYSLPFIPFFWNKKPDAFHGASPVEEQIPIQKELNMLGSLIMINARTVASPKLLVPRGSGIKEEKLKGNLIHFDASGGGVPTSFAGQGVAHQLIEWFGVLKNEMQDIVGVHEVSLGQMPERGTGLPASGLKLLMDAEAVRYAPQMRYMKESLQHAAGMILRLMKKYYLEERFIDILGDGNQYELKAFKNSDLDGNFDITLQVASALNTSAAAKTETLLNLIDRGIPQAAEEGQKWAAEAMTLLEFGNVEDFRKKEKMFRKKANWILEQSKKGDMPDVFEWVDEQIVLDVFTEYINSDEWEDLADDHKDAILKMLDKYKKNQEKKQGGGQQQGAPGGQPPPVNDMAQADAMGMGMPMNPEMMMPPQMPPPGGGPIPGDAGMIPPGPMPPQGVI